MPRPIAARIDLAALRHNLAVARRYAGTAKVFAVAKAAAYGHGLARVLPVLRDADGIALLDLADAVAVRDAGYTGRVLLLEGCFGVHDLVAAAERGIGVVVHDGEQAAMLEGVSLPAPAAVALKMNTGMNRLGFSPAAFRGVLERLERSRNVRDLVLMTHFASSDDGRGVEEQMRRFGDAVRGSPHPVTMANSAALVGFAAARREWVRPGIMLYGATPFADRSAAGLGLRPVMTLTSRLIAIQDVAAGEAVGYGHEFVAPAPMRIGVVACGYADGYPRHAPTGTPVLVAGVRTRLVGRVSMDMVTVDLGPVPNAAVGSEVTLWGDGLSVDEVATAARTVGYELLCALAPRVPVSVLPA